MAETKIHVSSGSLAEQEVRKTSSAKVKKWSNKVKLIVFLGTYYPVKIHGGKVPWIFSACRRYRESIYERTWNVISSTTNLKTKKRGERKW